MAHLEVVNRSINPGFSNTLDNDAIFYTDRSNQRVIIGCGSNTSSNATFVVSNSNVAVMGDIVLTGNILKNGNPFQSGTPGLSNTSTAVYVLSGSNFGIGTSTPSSTLDVAGNVNFTGSLTRNGVAFQSGTPGLSNNSSNIFVVANSNFGIGTSTNATTTVTSIPNISSTTNGIQVSSHILPSATLTYDLGSSNNRFRDLYLSGNTIDMIGTKISVDASSNVTIMDGANNLKRLIVDEIQIGNSNATGAVRIKRDPVTNSVKFFQVAQGTATEVADTNVGGGVTLSNLTPTIANPSVANGYQANVMTVPRITTKAVPSTAKIHYGRVELDSYAGCSLSNNASLSFNVTHNIGNSNYIVYAMPEDASKLQVGTSNYQANTFAMSVKNISGAVLANPAINYQLIQATLNNTVSVLAAAPTLVTATSNITAYSSSASTSNLISLAPFVSDIYPVGFSVTTDNTGKASAIGSNISYVHNKATTASKSIIVAASNIYSPSQVNFTVNLTESNLTGILASHPTSYTSNQATTGVAAVTSNLPATDQGLPLVWTTSNNTLPGSTISGNSFQFNTAGSNVTRGITLVASFAANIMASANLASKSIALSFLETYTSPGVSGTWSLYNNVSPMFTFTTPQTFANVQITGFSTTLWSQWLNSTTWTNFPNPTTIGGSANSGNYVPIVRFYTSSLSSAASVRTTTTVATTAPTYAAFFNNSYTVDGAGLPSSTISSVQAIRLYIRTNNGNDLDLGDSTMVTPAMTLSAFTNVSVVIS